MATNTPEPSVRSNEMPDQGWLEWRADIASKSDELVELVVELDDPTESQFWNTWRKPENNGVSKASLINARIDELNLARAPFEQFIQGMGGTLHYRYWTSNAVHIRIAANDVERIETHPGVIGIWPALTQGENSWDMYDIMGSKNQNSGKIFGRPWEKAGIYGEDSGRVTTPDNNIKLCFVEWLDEYDPDDVINNDHAAFVDYVGGGSKIQNQEICYDGQCILAINTGSGNHVTWMAALAAGSIEQGQDPSYTTETSRAARSGASQETSIFTFLAEKHTQTQSEKDASAAAYRKAFERCLESNVDVVINASGFLAQSCSASQNPAGIRSTLNSLLDDGVPIVSAAGNFGTEPPTTCTVTGPAVYPETISVGALNPNSSYGGEPANSGNSGSDRRASSSTGHTVISRYSGNGTANVPAVTIAAPSVIDNVANSGTSGPGAYANSPITGTSAATAITGGVVGLMLEAMRESQLNPDYLMMNAAIALLGDGATSPTTKSRTFVDDEFGFGRLKMQLPINGTPDEVGEIEASKYNVTSITLNSGQAAYIPLGCYSAGCADTYSGIKAALFVEDPGRNSYWIPNVDFQIVDACTSGLPIIKEASTSDFLWKRIRVFDTWRFKGKCPYMRVYLDDVSYFQNVRMGVAGYMFGPGNPFWENH